MEIITTAQGWEFLLRYLHFLAGIIWIGVLYYFNFIQTPFFASTDADVRSGMIRGLVPSALWWFRWGAMFTFLSGVALIGMKQLSGMGIMVGAVLGTLMSLNVWLIIWPCQKIVIASAKQVAGGGEALVGAGAALGKAGLASRTNTLFSIPMLFFMASSIHLGGLQTSVGSVGIVSLALSFGLIAALQLNGMFGKTGPITTVKGVIHSGFFLTIILYLLIEMT